MRIAVAGFDWDDGNRHKCGKHGLSITEIEYVLTHTETLIVPDERNSKSEPRFIAIGRTQANRYAFVVFTPREQSAETVLRPISARFMHRKEIDKYAKEISRPEDR